MKHQISIEDMKKPCIDEVWASSLIDDEGCKYLICHVEIDTKEITYEVYVKLQPFKSNANTSPIFTTPHLNLAVDIYNQY